MSRNDDFDPILRFKDLKTRKFWIFCVIYFPVMFGITDLIYYSLNGYWMPW